MQPILKVKEWLNYSKGQFMPLEKIEVTYEGETGFVVEKVMRLKDGKIFNRDEVIHSNERIVKGIVLTEEVRIDFFHDDNVHVDVNAYSFSENYKYCAGVIDTMEINDLEKSTKDLLKEMKERFNERYPTMKD